MARNPIIASIIDARKAQLDAQGAGAQVLATIQEERKRATERQQAKREQRAVTARQAAEGARREAQQQERDAVRSLSVVMPQPQTIRTDEQGLQAGLATGSAGSIGGLDAIVEAVTGGAEVQEVLNAQPAAGGAEGGGDPMDPLGVNRVNPIEGGKLGSDVSVGPGGVYTRTTRRAADLGRANLLNTMFEAATGKPLFVTETREELPGLRLQVREMQRLQQQAAFNQRKTALDELQEERKFAFDGALELQDRGVPPAQSLPAMRAFVRGDDATFNKIAGQGLKRELLRRQVDAETALTEQRLAAAEENRLRAEKLGLENEALWLEALQPLDSLGGIPAPKGLKATNVFSDFEKAFDDTGAVREAFTLQAKNAQRIMFRSGNLLLYGVEKLPENVTERVVQGAQRAFNAIAGREPPGKSIVLPIPEVLNMMIAEDRLPDPVARKRTRERLLGLNLFTEEGEALVPIYQTDPFHPNADASRGIENLYLRLSTASPEATEMFLKTLERKVGAEEAADVRQRLSLPPRTAGAR